MAPTPPRVYIMRLAAAAALLLPACPAAAQSAPSQASVTARGMVESEMLNLPNEKARVERAVVIAFIRENTTPEVRRAAREFLRDFDPRLIMDRAGGFYPGLSPERQIEMIELLDWCYPNMKGYDFRLNNIVAMATASPNRAVRRAGSELAGRYKVREAYFPLRRTANRSSGQDRLEAIRTLGAMADARGIYFLPDLLNEREPGVTEAVLESLGRLGRLSAVVLKERMASADPHVSLAALRVLMTMPAVDDLPAYYVWIQSHAEVQDPLKTEIYNLIAHLEVARDKGVETPRD